MSAGEHNIDDSERQHVRDMIAPIAEKWGTIPTADEYFRSYRSPIRSRAKDTRIKEGLTRLQDVGSTLFDMKIFAIQGKLSKVRKTKPVWKLEEVELKPYPRKIPLCNVCRDLVRSMRPVENYDDDD